MIGSIRHWSPDLDRETVFELLGKGLGKSLLGLSDTSSGLRHFVRLHCVKAGPILCQALVEPRVEKPAVLANALPWLCAEYPRCEN